MSDMGGGRGGTSGDGGRRRGGLFDDLAGVAGGAFSALAGVRTEVEAMARSQAEALVQRLELVRREELDAALEVARRAREELDAALEVARRAREQAEALEARVAALEARLSAGGGGGKAAADDEMPTEPLEAYEPPPGKGLSGEERNEAMPGGI